jgi:hypothetical protein
LFDADSLNEVRRFEEHNEFIRALAFSADGLNQLSGHGRWVAGAQPVQPLNGFLRYGMRPLHEPPLGPARKRGRGECPGGS